MPKVRLTESRIAALIPTQDTLLRDTESHLAVRARRTGSKVFVFTSTLNYKDVRITMGETGSLSLAEARQKARDWQGFIDAGKDPREVIREQAEADAKEQLAEQAAAEAERLEAEQRERFTLRKLCEAYTEHLEARGKGRSAKDAASGFKCHVFEPFPRLAATPAREVTALQMAEVVRKVFEVGKERTAGKLRSYLYAAYRAAIRAPFDAKLPSAMIAFGVTANPVEPVATIGVRAGSRTLSNDELKSYMAALGDSPTDCALRVALLAGGQRIAQLLRARPADFDAEAGTLRLFDPKGKRKNPRLHVLPLAPIAAALVGKLSERAKEEGLPLMFSGYGRPMAPETISNRVTEISRSLDGEPFQARDVRRTCETMLAGMGISKDVRAHLLSHGLSGVQDKHYDMHTYLDEKRNALVAWEAKLDAIAKGEEVPANVRPLRKADEAA